MPQIGEQDYRNGAKERLAEAGRLFQGDQFSGCVYLAGRAVEGMLRGLIWKLDPEYRVGKKSLETGHDLKDLLKLVEGFGLLSDQNNRDDEMRRHVQNVARRWHNNMRFVPERWIASYWRTIAVITSRNTMRHAAREFYRACSMIIKRCEVLYDQADKK